MRSTLRSLQSDESYAVREVSREDGMEYVIDFGAHVDTVDVLDDAVIVVPPEGDQFEIPLPRDQAHAFMKNGVLTIEVRE